MNGRDNASDLSGLEARAQPIMLQFAALAAAEPAIPLLLGGRLTDRALHRHPDAARTASCESD